MSPGVLWVFDMMGKILALTWEPLWGVPLFVYPVVFFLFSQLAKFLHGRK